MMLQDLDKTCSIMLYLSEAKILRIQHILTKHSGSDACMMTAQKLLDEVDFLLEEHTVDKETSALLLKVYFQKTRGMCSLQMHTHPVY